MIWARMLGHQTEFLAAAAPRIFHRRYETAQ